MKMSKYLLLNKLRVFLITIVKLIEKEMKSIDKKVGNNYNNSAYR